MSYSTLSRAYPWHYYSKKAKRKFFSLHCKGVISQEEAKAKGLRLLCFSRGFADEGNSFELFLLLDEDDGKVVDARYQAYAQTALLLALEGLCQLIIGKDYLQASELSSDELEAYFADKSKSEAFPKEVYPHLNLALDALSELTSKANDIPLPDGRTSPLPSTKDKDANPEFYEGLSYKEKVLFLRKVLEEQVQPFVAMDGGGVELVELKEPFQVTIAYQGACTTCFASVGSTLQAIEQILQNKVHPCIKVTPDVDLPF